MKIEINIPDELPIGRKSSYLKGIIEALEPAATVRSGQDHTPDGHDLYRAKGAELGRQLIDVVDSITKR